MNDSPIGLYIHIPFCEKKCPYCDFNTYAGLQAQFQETVDALCLEMEAWREVLAGRSLSTIFMGGGTPTVLSESQLAQIFATIRRSFEVAEEAEITSEANPGTVDQAKFQALRRLGVNRLSLGVQSFQPDELRFLGRIHDVADVERAVELARTAGFDNLNLDFIFGLPGQSLESWADSVEKALRLQPEHVSLYSLIVEPNTPLFHWVKQGQVTAPDEDLAADHYEFAIKRLAEAGYRQYEVSNWAKEKGARGEGRGAGTASSATCNLPPATFLDERVPGYASRHNLLYWRNAEYLGIGPGAHSHVRMVVRQEADDQSNGAFALIGKRWGNRKPVPGYVRRLQQGKSVEESHERIDASTAMNETMMLGLRLVEEGVSYRRFQALHQADLRQVYRHELNKLQQLGLLQMDESRVYLTHRGLLLGNQVFLEFM